MLLRGPFVAVFRSKRTTFRSPETLVLCRKTALREQEREGQVVWPLSITPFGRSQCGGGYGI